MPGEEFGGGVEDFNIEWRRSEEDSGVSKEGRETERSESGKEGDWRDDWRWRRSSRVGSIISRSERKEV